MIQNGAGAFRWCTVYEVHIVASLSGLREDSFSPFQLLSDSWVAPFLLMGGWVSLPYQWFSGKCCCFLPFVQFLYLAVRLQVSSRGFLFLNKSHFLCCWSGSLSQQQEIETQATSMRLISNAGIPQPQLLKWEEFLGFQMCACTPGCCLKILKTNKQNIHLMAASVKALASCLMAWVWSFDPQG